MWKHLNQNHIRLCQRPCCTYTFTLCIRFKALTANVDKVPLPACPSIILGMHVNAWEPIHVRMCVKHKIGFFPSFTHLPWVLFLFLKSHASVSVRFLLMYRPNIQKIKTYPLFPLIETFEMPKYHSYLYLYIYNTRTNKVNNIMLLLYSTPSSKKYSYHLKEQVPSIWTMLENRHRHLFKPSMIFFGY